MSDEESFEREVRFSILRWVTFALGVAGSIAARDEEDARKETSFLHNFLAPWRDPNDY